MLKKRIIAVVCSLFTLFSHLSTYPTPGEATAIEEVIVTPTATPTRNEVLQVRETEVKPTSTMEIVTNTPTLKPTNTPIKTLSPTETPKPTVETVDTNEKIYYSDTIKVLVTPEQKKIVEEKLENYSKEIIMLAKVVYREAGGVPYKHHQAAVIWCILNRVDHESFDNSIKKVITAKNQFAWIESTPILDEFVELSKDVMTRWLLEKEGIEDNGRVLPKDYLYFAGRNGLNHFRKKYKDNKYWNWSLESPYD